MNNQQVTAARRALLSFSDRVKVDISRVGGVATLTPYLIATPATRGTPVEVVANVTAGRVIADSLSASIEALLS